MTIISLDFLRVCMLQTRCKLLWILLLMSYAQLSGVAQNSDAQCATAHVVSVPTDHSSSQVHDQMGKLNSGSSLPDQAGMVKGGRHWYIGWAYISIWVDDSEDIIYWAGLLFKSCAWDSIDCQWIEWLSLSRFKRKYRKFPVIVPRKRYRKLLIF